MKKTGHKTPSTPNGVGKMTSSTVMKKAVGMKAKTAAQTKPPTATKKMC